MNDPDRDFLRRAALLPDAIESIAGPAGIAALRLNGPAGRVDVAAHGAHVLQWTPPDGAAPVLFLSARSRFARGEPIRGGVPIVFPWFGPHPRDPALPAHGFARRRPFVPVGGRADRHGAELRLELTDDADTLRQWPHAFRLTLRMRVTDALELGLCVENRGIRPLAADAMLHTYLQVGDAARCEVHGLAGRPFRDQLQGRVAIDAREPLRVAGELDRSYADAPGPVLLVDPALGRGIVVETHGAPSKVVWNPHVAKARRLPDLGNDEWRRFVCLETGWLGAQRLQLAPGERAEAVTRIRLARA
ncbi:MAG: D-hexose-6-phosphate mutarotase [Planctomycetes bacterium]|nr:D-hexose-6-phosphate mutarotase [Planctomycetota bacterium]